MNFIIFWFNLTILMMPSSLKAVVRLCLRRSNDVGAFGPVPPLSPLSFIAIRHLFGDEMDVQVVTTTNLGSVDALCSIFF